jgi:hypothetical protein
VRGGARDRLVAGAGWRKLLARSMTRQPPLSRAAVIAGLRDHAARHGEVSPASLAKHDRPVLRSVRGYFPSLEAALRAARVPVGRPAPAGVSYAGGLARARAQAGVRRPERRRSVLRWDKVIIVHAIEDRVRKRQTLASSKAPARLVAAARWHFGSWDAALAAAGVEAEAVRLQRRPYTRTEILARLRRLARDGTELRSSTLKAVVKLETVRKLFGSVEGAVRAAGMAYVRRKPNQKWSRAGLIAELRSRARRGEVTLTRGLSAAVQRYFGGAHAARVAAGVATLARVPWTKSSLIEELQQRARRGDSGHTLWTACKRLFGSVAAARRAAGVPATQRTRGMVAWDKPALLAELRHRIRTRRPLGRGLTEGLRRQFCSLTAARARASVPAR